MLLNIVSMYWQYLIVLTVLLNSIGNTNTNFQKYEKYFIFELIQIQKHSASQ